LCYKYGFKLDQVLNYTIPQIKILEMNLYKICKAEAGGEDTGSSAGGEDTKNMANRLAFAGTIKMLKEKTGRSEFTMAELNNPADTIKKHNLKKVKNG